MASATATSEPTFALRWGIIATGRICQEFVKDLLIDPTTRDTHDVTHKIVAVGSSTSKEKAEQFISKMGIPADMDCKAHGSYEELVQQDNVDAVYIGTPHSHHFSNAMLALRAGKHVLCEKSLTVNVNQARVLFQEAAKQKLFLMEAVWTKLFPICREIRQLIRKREIGTVLRVFADTSLGKPEFEKDWDPSNRMINPKLAGGVLLDSGVYSLTWGFLSILETLPLEKRKAPYVVSQLDMYEPTGVDESAGMLVQFANSAPVEKYRAHAIATASFRGYSDTEGKNGGGPTVRIQGSHGEIKVFGRGYRPTGFWVVPTNQDKSPRRVVQNFPGDGRGMYWEADEVARCVHEGRKESTHMTWAESVLTLEIMDQVRMQNEMRYPEEVESNEYPD